MPKNKTGNANKITRLHIILTSGLKVLMSLCRIVETTPSPRPPEAESYSAGEGTESKETADMMSPEHGVTVDTSGVVTGERDQVLDTKKIETIASTFEEICTYLIQAEHLIVSGLFHVFTIFAFCLLPPPLPDFRGLAICRTLLLNSDPFSG